MNKLKKEELVWCKECGVDNWCKHYIPLKKPTKEKIEEMKILKIDPAYVSEDLQVEMNILRSVVNQVIKVVNKINK